METNKLSNHQMFSLAANCSIGGTLIVVSAALAKIAQRDAWLAALIAPAVGSLVIWIYCRLGARHPGLTLIGITKAVLGKWAGTLVSCGFLFLFFLLACHVPWYVGDFATHIMVETPMSVVNLAFLIPVVIALWYGIEVIARASELYILVVSVFFFAAMVLVTPQSDLGNLKPILENGFGPVLAGAAFLSCFLAMPLIALLMIYPRAVAEPPKASRAIYKGYLWASLFVFIALFVTILVLGNTIISRQEYPTYALAREIDIGGIFSRLEYFISITWIMTQFMIMVLLSYALLAGLSELIGLKDYRKLVAPMGLVILAMSEIVYPDTVYQAHWVKFTYAPYMFTVGAVLPGLLLLVDVLKARIGARPAQ